MLKRLRQWLTRMRWWLSVRRELMRLDRETRRDYVATQRRWLWNHPRCDPTLSYDENVRRIRGG